MLEIPKNIKNKDLYLNAKNQADNVYKRHSAYKSAYIHKLYKKLGGKYKYSNNKPNLLNRWFKEEWIQVEPYIKENKKIICGDDNKENKACRPFLRIDKYTPLTLNELIDKLGKDDILKKAMIKNNNMDVRINWEIPLEENINGGFIPLKYLENIIKPIKYVKNLSTALNYIRKDKNKAFIKDDDKIFAKISKDVYNKPNERKIEGYIPNLSNDEIATYNINNNIIVGIRGTVNKNDILTDTYLASGKLKNTNRYKNNKKFIKNIYNTYGKIDYFTGHSMGGALSQLMSDLYKNSYAVVFNPGTGITGSYGNKKSTVYVSEGDPVSALGMFNKKNDIRIIKSKGDSILDRHAMDNFINGGFLKNNLLFNNKYNNMYGGAITKLDVYDFIKSSTKQSLLEFINDIKPTENIIKLGKLSKNDLVNWIKNNIKVKQIGDINTFKLRYPGPIKGINFEKKLDLKKLKQPQLKILEDEQIQRLRNSMPYQGIKPSLTFGENNKISEKLETVILQPHQKNLLEAFFGSDRRSCVIFHGVGTGKTYTAVGITKLYLQLYPNNKVYFITPSAVVFNMIETIFGYGLDPRDPRFMYFTYDKFYRSNINTKDSLVIIDEAHNFRTEIGISIIDKGNETDKIYTGNKRGSHLIESVGIGYKNKLKQDIGPAHKVIALTATPFVNKTYDIENLIALCDGRLPRSEAEFGQIISNFNFAYDYFKYRISIYTNKDYLSLYPERREYFIPIVAPNTDHTIKARISCKEGKCENSFYIDSRKASIAYDGKKINYIKDVINKEKDKKYVIYTGFLDSGVEPLINMVNSINLKYGLITGSISTQEKGLNISKYNNNEINVLIITRAGAEGVSLKETRGLFVLDGQWNDALYEQIVARAIRYKSHSNLPKNEQYVNIYKLFVCYEKEKEILDGLTQGKKFDFIEIKNKIDAVKQLEKINEQEAEDLEATILKKRKNTRREINVDKLIKNTGIFDFNELDKLKKGTQARREYIQENLAFGKDREKYIANSLLTMITSTDYYLFILQKSKQQVINSFITVMDNIPKLESIKKLYPEKFINLDNLYNELKNNKINTEIYIKKFLEEMKSVDIQKINNTIKQQQKTQGDALNQLDNFIKQSEKRKQLQNTRQLLKVKQEFFTPDAQVEELINLSKIKDEGKNKSLSILEPTAGFGNIICGLLEIMTSSLKGKQFNIKLHIDMVEKDEVNRKQLLQLEKSSPGVLDLLNCNDFLKFIPSSNYDYIFMNPPFHLEKRYNKDYNKDYYDIDFVMRAYAMLKPYTGVLVAIVGRSWEKNEKYQQFLIDVDAKVYNKEEYWGQTEKYKDAGVINKLKYSLIYIRKLENNMVLDNKLLEIPEELQTITDDLKNDAIVELTAENINIELTNEFINNNAESVEQIGDIIDNPNLLNDVIENNNNIIDLNNTKIDVIEDDILTNKEKQEIENKENKINKDINNKNYNNMKLSELKTLAKKNNIKGYSKLKKDEIINLLNKNKDNTKIDAIDVDMLTNKNNNKDNTKIDAIDVDMLTNKEINKKTKVNKNKTEKQYKSLLDDIDNTIDKNNGRTSNIPRDLKIEQYKKLQNLNKLMNFKTIDDYRKNIIKLKPKNEGIFNNIDIRYFKNDEFKNWYDFLGLDYSKYPESFDDWKEKVRSANLATEDFYYNYVKKNKDLPKYPRMMYKNKPDNLKEILNDVFDL
jgi:hypothetical protein